MMQTNLRITDTLYLVVWIVQNVSRGLRCITPTMNMKIRKNMTMIQIKITPEIIARAKKKAATVGNLQGSITGSLSNVVGAIGEVVVEDYTGGIEANSKDFDLMVGNRRVDVKTKRCNTKPAPNYDCSVAAHGTK